MVLGQETLGFRRQGFSPCLSLLMSAFALPAAPQPIARLLHRNRNAPLRFPLDNEAYPPLSHSRASLIEIRSLIGFGRLESPLAHSVLYPRRCYPRRHVNAFRGEPAIPKFDWPFTPIHSSSPEFSTSVGSALHAVLPTLQPVHG